MTGDFLVKKSSDFALWAQPPPFSKEAKHIQMFDQFSNKITKIFDTLSGKKFISEDDLNATMREVRIALLEADVALPIAKSFIESVKAVRPLYFTRAVGGLLFLGGACLMAYNFYKTIRTPNA